MSTKYLSGAYPGGYALSPGYGGLVIETTASVGGSGVSAAAAATITNHGSVSAGGVYLAAGGAVANGSVSDTTALIAGGHGISAAGPALVANYATIRGSGGVGVLLTRGGTIDNGSAGDVAALIEGAISGVVSNDPLSTVANLGTIRGQVSFGVDLSYGGALTNGSAADTSALIAGYNSGVLCQNLTATIVNYGFIEGAPFYGVRLTAGGTITNGSAADTGAVIGGELGLYAQSATAAVTVINFGTILGNGTALAFASAADVLVVEAGSAFHGAVQGGGATLDLASGTGTLGNFTGGAVTVSGSMAPTTFSQFGTLEIATGADFTLTGAGVSGTGTGEVIVNGAFTVAGAITYKGAFIEGAAARLTLAPSSGDRLTLDGEASLAGALGGRGLLRLADATLGALTVTGRVSLEDTGMIEQTGAITGGSAGTGSITIDAAGAYVISADVGLSFAASRTFGLVNSGLFIKSGGAGPSVIALNTTNDGTLEAATGTLDFTGAIAGAGVMKVDGGATLEADSGAAAAQTLIFTHSAATGGILTLREPSRFAATISGFAAGDTIELSTRKATRAVLGAGDTLVITNGAKAVATLRLTGDYTGDTFTASSDGAGGTKITVAGGSASAPPRKWPPESPSESRAVGGHASGAVIRPARVHHFVDAMAGWSVAGATSHAPAVEPAGARRSMLSRPAVA